MDEWKGLPSGSDNLQALNFFQFFVLVETQRIQMNDVMLTYKIIL